jgi:hypothetical protein
MHASNNMRCARSANTYPGAGNSQTRKPALASLSPTRLALVEARNDDGHVVGLEPCWLAVVARLAGVRR